MHRAARSLGWWAISGEELLHLLHRASVGEDPDLLYAEAYANSQVATEERPAPFSPHED